MAAILNENANTFVIYVTALSFSIMQIYSFYQVQIGLLLADKAPIKVLPKYLDYADIFLLQLAIKLLENTGMNKYTIKPLKDK